MVELSPTLGIEIAEQSRGIVVPTPPQVAGQGPEPLLRGSDKTIESAGLADHRRHLRGSLGQHANLVLRKGPELDRLHNEDALEHASIDERNSEKRLVSVFASFLEILETGMIFGAVHGNRTHLLRNQASQAFVQSEMQSSDTLRPQSNRSGQYQVASIWFQQIDRTDVGLEPSGD